MTRTLPVLLPARVLLLGSGGLGKGVVVALRRYGCTVIACNSYGNAPAMQVTDESRVSDISDPQALCAVLDSVDVDLIVPEVEAIATDELSAYEEHGVRVIPNVLAVQATMDRQRTCSLAVSLPGVRTSAFRFARSEIELAAVLDEVGYPAFVKPTMFSSGHGQSRVTDPEQAASARIHAEEGAQTTTDVVIAEEGADFNYEIALLTVRPWDAASGSVVTSFCAPIGHRREGGDYVKSQQLMAMNEAALEGTRQMAKAVTDVLAEAGDGPRLGISGVEFFVKDDDVWFSELSPRPHDTGMMTMATQAQSEFRLHARAILGLPVSTAWPTPGASTVIKSMSTVDVLVCNGAVRALESIDIVRISGKSASHAGRRVGIVATTASTPKEARVIARRSAAGIAIDKASAPSVQHLLSPDRPTRQEDAMTGHTPTGTHDTGEAQTSSMNEENPPAAPEGIAVCDMARVKYELRASNEVLAIIGYSGAGRTGAARVLEGLNWYVVGNLPPAMLPALVDMMLNDPAAGVHRLAVGVDVCSRTFFRTFDTTLEQLKGVGIVCRVIFLEASLETLVCRYESNHRPHPLQGADTFMDGTKAEMRLLAPLRHAADEVIDTSTMSVHDLTRRIRDIVAGEERPLQVTVESFGFKHDLPLNADHVVDVRFLKNPYWVDGLRHLIGKDRTVVDYVLSQPGACDFALGYADLLVPMLSGCLAELKPFVTITVGCTGGKHRSVASSGAIAERLRSHGYTVRVMHRDTGRDRCPVLMQLAGFNVGDLAKTLSPSTADTVCPRPYGRCAISPTR